MVYEIVGDFLLDDVGFQFMSFFGFVSQSKSKEVLLLQYTVWDFFFPPY